MIQNKKILIGLVIFVLPVMVYAQGYNDGLASKQEALGRAGSNGPVEMTQETITGTVTDGQSDKTLPGVNILVKGTTTGTSTDADGNFELTVPSLQDTLVVSFVGYQTQEIPINGRTKINVTMQVRAISGEEMVVVGYGTQKKSDLTGSIGSVDEQALEQSSPANVQEALQGRIAGVQVSRGSGRPGGNSTVRIRGYTSITGSNDPLYVVDGVIVNTANLANGTSPIDYINPQNVKSIDVLKDASSTAIYGARGSNGVVVITTKQPKKNKITYNGSVSIGTLPKEIGVLNSNQFLHVENIAYQNAAKFGLAGTIEEPVKKRTDSRLFDSAGNPRYNTDWQKAGTRTAISNDHHISFGGGDGNTNYGVSLGYSNQNGIIRRSGSKTYSGRFFVHNQINSWLTASGSINYSITNQDQPRSVGAAGITPPRSMLEATPITPVRYPNGEFGHTEDYPGMEGGAQPVRLVNQRNRLLNTHNTLGNARVNIKLAKGLEFQSTLGVNITDQKEKYFAAPNLRWITNNGAASISSVGHTSWQEESQFTYKTNFSENQSFKALLAASWQNVHSFSSNASVSDLNTLFYKYNNLGAASVSTLPRSNAGEFSLNSYFARVNYSINDKYLFTATGRYDGSSKFAKANQYGLFPSGAFAWKISNEDFLKDNSVISNLKLRASYGITGNSQIPNYRTVGGLGNYSYIINGKLASGVGVGTLANSSLKWEKDKEADIGIDLGLFKDRVSFTGDVYYKKSTNILLDAPIPATSGYTSVIRNIGSMENRGIELTVNTTNIRRSNFSWSTNFNISMNRNKVLHLVGGQDILGAGDTIIREGEPINSFYGYVTLGTWNTDQAKQAAKYKELPGDIRFKDVNNDGEINASDKKIVGNGLPKGEGSLINTFNYRNFQLVVNLQYVFGSDVSWETKYSTFNRTGIANSLSGILDAWTPNHQNTPVPQIRPDAGYIKPAQEKDTRIYDGSFIRGKRIQLAYNFSPEMTNKWDINNLRVYVAANNLFLITSFPGYDPEVSSVPGNFTQGADYYSYPKPRTFQFGLSFSL